MIDAKGSSVESPPAYETGSDAPPSMPTPIPTGNPEISQMNAPPKNIGYTGVSPFAGPQLIPGKDNAAIGAQYQAELFARCARGEHQATVKYGPCGIITAIFCFPLGLFCLILDKEKHCSRCGARLN